jgi:ABC-type uncharacterized transport system ATPase subunit
MTMIETAKAPQAQSHSGLLLDVKDLRVTFKTPDGDVTAVNDLNFTLQAGETLGIVGNPAPVNRKPPLPDGPAGGQRSHRGFRHL